MVGAARLKAREDITVLVVGLDNSSWLGKLKTPDWKTPDWKRRKRIVYGKPIKPKQPTHFLTLIYRGMTAADSGSKTPKKANQRQWN